MHPLILASLGGAALTVLIAGFARGKAYAGFVGVLLTIHSLVLVGLQDELLRVAPLLAWLQVAVLVHLLSLVWARLRPNWYRALVSIPAHYFLAATFLAFPWAIASAVGLPPFGWWLPFVAAALGVVQSLRSTQEVVDLVLDGQALPELQRTAVRRRRSLRKATDDGAPLRLVQITDPHLGPFMSEERLRGICERAVESDPHLVLLTGDFFTMEGRGSGDALARALAPLAALEGRTFACHGNHDLEAPEAVAEGLAAVGVKLLVDDFTEVETPVGPVQIVGLDHHWGKRSERYGEVWARLPDTDGLRLVLLHDPGGFKHLPVGQADLVLAGHTHGGHVGLLSLGLDWTSIGAIARMPDHGFWGRGTDRMYVHRANGHYGFPLRVGVPSEESVLRVHRP